MANTIFIAYFIFIYYIFVRYYIEWATMAIADSGINGPFRGKVGSIIGYKLNGQNVIRSVGRRTRPFSKLELLNQAKMRVTSAFLAGIKPFVKFGFRGEAPEGSRIGAFQMAQSYVRKHALAIDESGQPYVDPEKVLISKGNLEPPLNCRVHAEGNRLFFRWDNAHRYGFTQRLLTLAYDGGLTRFFRDLGGRASLGEDTWDLSALDRLERPLHVYAAFRDTMTDEISDSVYCGAIVPAAPSVPDIDPVHPQTAPAPPSLPSGQFELTFPDR